jgi:hypothetical protein
MERKKLLSSNDLYKIKLLDNYFYNTTGYPVYKNQPVTDTMDSRKDKLGLM